MYKLFCSLFLFAVATPRPMYAQSQDTAMVHSPVSPVLAVPVVMLGYGVAALHTTLLNNWNQDVHHAVAQENGARHTTVDNYLQWAPAAAVYGLNLAGIKGRHNFTDRSFIFGIASLLQGSSSYALKKVSRETRPDYSNNLSFPSGHTATAFANAEFMRMEYKDVSPWYGVAGYAAATATGYLRMYNNKHWLSDVVAGAGLGILSTQAAYFLYPKLVRVFHRPKHIAPTIQ